MFTEEGHLVDGHLIVVDASTSAVKSFLYDLSDGTILASAKVDITADVPEPGAAEVDSRLWWEGVCQTSRELMERTNADTLRGVTVTSQQISCVFLDEAGKPAAPAYLWMDTRCTESIEALSLRCEKEGLGTGWITSMTGIPPSDSWGLAKLLWFRERDPLAFSRIRQVASVDAFLLDKLSGRFVSDETSACFFHLDIRCREPALELLLYLDIDPALFPEIVPPGTLIGTVTAEAAQMSGLPEGLPVIAAASDQPCALLGMGAVRPGEAVINLGTGTFFMTPLASPITDNRMMTNIGAATNSWLMMGTHYLTGGALSWLRDLLSEGGAPLSFAQLGDLAQATPPGADGLTFLPGLSGTGTPRWDPEARGLFAGLGLGHGAGHLARAVMESTGYGVRTILETFAELGIAFEKLIFSGGPASSEVWRQALADIVQRPLTLSEAQEATPLGAAMLAASALGRFSSPEEGVRSWTSEAQIVKPRSEFRDVYDRMYARYRAWTDAEASVRRST
ncbi:FGGY-family carbohydrate kinase [Cohnella sp. AR92]|uniref:xylulokinase n=1 Tax=Cohnella sp. AR92 TaxID=648716 RepID=UPI00131510B1|nr:FGGY family carbohydrate kinase [Cohnella sp. AR92]